MVGILQHGNRILKVWTVNVTWNSKEYRLWDRITRNRRLWIVWRTVDLLRVIYLLLNNLRSHVDDYCNVNRRVECPVMILKFYQKGREHYSSRGKSEGRCTTLSVLHMFLGLVSNDCLRWRQVVQKHNLTKITFVFTSNIFLHGNTTLGGPKAPSPSRPVCRTWL